MESASEDFLDVATLIPFQVVQAVSLFLISGSVILMWQKNYI
jgi:uncharacterized membrane protein